MSKKVEKPARELFMLVGNRFDKESKELYNSVMLYEDRELKTLIYRITKKYDKEEYEKLIKRDYEDLSQKPVIKSLIERRTIEGYWKGYYSILLGAGALVEILDDLRLSGVEKINWVVYGREGKVVSAYLDNYFDLDYHTDSKNGKFTAGTSGRYRKYYGIPEARFVDVCCNGVDNVLSILAKNLEIDVAPSLEVGKDNLYEELKDEPYNCDERRTLKKNMDTALSHKARYFCKKENIGAEWRV